MKYLPTIGIETHVQLRTKTKLFCGCDNDARQAQPNSLICPVCLGLPGSLPVLNQGAVQLALKAGLALSGQIPSSSRFVRKNYFYPDLPKGYQISQLDRPIIGPGLVKFPLEERWVEARINRAQLEEDAGKLNHPEGADYSLVDLNRAGTPLLEIVSEPDLHSPAEAKAYAQEIYNLVRYSEVSDADLYYGNMRFDVNVSLGGEGESLGTRTETKNLNSFRAVERAVAYEIERQTELLAKGQSIIQETRGWNDAKGQTFSQRSKEEAHDYRYFPEPDLPPVAVTQEMVTAAKNALPPLPNQVRQELKELGVNYKEQEMLIPDRVAAGLFLRIAKESPAQAKFSLNWLIGDRKWLEQETNRTLGQSGINESTLPFVGKMVGDGKLSSTNAKILLRQLWEEGKGLSSNDIEKWGSEHNLIQLSDTTELGSIIDRVILEHPKPVADFQAGQTVALKFLVGQVMKSSAGAANPAMVSDILKEKLEQ
jgi:aspartyl-tRNA(Asn)/glutamyl-tRNA(Gln) amidotransferase subunit B